MGQVEHQVAAYADDILFFLEQPRTSIPNLLEAFRKYNLVSNLKLNLSKSEAMPVTRAPKHLHKLLSQFPFKLREDKL
ncbi:Hypothetical predicted protein [Pelobates cultripes]|uniref:Reverse transcriptase domain-containing protein n=1 Tax=Pelobates cultripes TaxID=61616 RepID=A0AAD1RFX7_PELCU|nr:Hypothetical predicted protein [Pelobates cultripes]